MLSDHATLDDIMSRARELPAGAMQGCLIIMLRFAVAAGLLRPLYSDLVDNRSGGVLGVLLKEYIREFLEGALWQFLTLLWVLGVRLGL